MLQITNNNELMQMTSQRIEQLGISKHWLSRDTVLGGHIYYHLQCRKKNGMKLDNLFLLFKLIGIEIKNDEAQPKSVDEFRQYVWSKCVNNYGLATKIARQTGIQASKINHFINPYKANGILSATFVKLCQAFNFKFYLTDPKIYDYGYPK